MAQPSARKTVTWPGRPKALSQQAINLSLGDPHQPAHFHVRDFPLQQPSPDARDRHAQSLAELWNCQQLFTRLHHDDTSTGLALFRSEHIARHRHAKVTREKPFFAFSRNVTRINRKA